MLFCKQRLKIPKISGTKFDKFLKFFKFFFEICFSASQFSSKTVFQMDFFLWLTNMPTQFFSFRSYKRCSSNYFEVILFSVQWSSTQVLTAYVAIGTFYPVAE